MNDFYYSEQKNLTILYKIVISFYVYHKIKKYNNFIKNN